MVTQVHSLVLNAVKMDTHYGHTYSVTALINNSRYKFTKQ